MGNRYCLQGSATVEYDVGTRDVQAGDRPAIVEGKRLGYIMRHMNGNQRVPEVQPLCAVHNDEAEVRGPGGAVSH